MNSSIGTVRPLSASRVHLRNSPEGGGGESASKAGEATAEDAAGRATLTDRMGEGAGATTAAARTTGATGLAGRTVVMAVRPAPTTGPPGMTGLATGTDAMTDGLTATVVHGAQARSSPRTP